LTSIPSESLWLGLSQLFLSTVSLDRQKGSHHQFKHPSFPGTITVSGGEGDVAKTYQKRQITKAIADTKWQKSNLSP
jgi:predicted RNA binding protein YcfA (HicA-like mRNA interferase family)